MAPEPTRRPAVSVLVEAGVHAAPGATATQRVHVRNVAGVPLDLLLTVVGLEGGWQPAPIAVPGVDPDATVTVELAMVPPVGVAAGDYPFLLTVESRSPDGQHRTSTADGSLRIDGGSGLVLTVEPADSRAVRSRRVDVLLANGGDAPARVRLDAVTGDGKDIKVRLDRTDVDVPPHSSLRVGARARVTRARLVGQPRRMPFRIVATGERAPQRFDATFTARPLLVGGMLRIAAIVGITVLWVGLVLAALPWVSQRFDGSRVAASPTQSATPTAGASDGTGGPGTGGDDGSGDGDGGDDDVPDGVVPDGVRVAGVVTSSDPGGVTVQLLPASTVTADEAEGAGGELPDAGPGASLPAGSAAGALAAPGTQGDVGKVSSSSLSAAVNGESNQRMSTVTGADGTWAFGGLSSSGRYLVVLAKPGYQTVRYWVTGAEAAATPLELEMTPGKGRLSGTVTSSGGAAGGVVVTISDGTTTVTTRSATSGRIGHWEVDGLATPTTYLVSASSDTLGTQAALVSLGAAQERSVDLRMDPSVRTLSGWVEGRGKGDAAGQPLGGVTVTAVAGSVVRTATTTTKDNPGLFVLPDLPVPATYTLTLSADGYATETRQLTLGTGGSAALHLNMAKLGGVVRGDVVDADTLERIGAAGVTLSGPNGSFKTMSTSIGAEDEGFRFDGIPSGQYVLTAESFGSEPASAQVVVVDGGTRTQDLMLTPIENDGLVDGSTIVGRVTDAATGGRIECPHPRPGEKCEVTVTTLARSSAGTRTITTTAGPDDPYTLPDDGSGLYPGLYRLTISAPGYEDGHVEVRVAMDQDVEAATVPLYPSPSINGSVSPRIGVVSTSTCVVAVPTGGDAPDADPCKPGTVADTCDSETGFCAFIGVNGGYELDRLPAGRYEVYAVPPAGGEYLSPSPVTVAVAGGDARRVDFTLDRYGVVFATVLMADASGALRPADGARVEAVGPGGTTTANTDSNGIARLAGLHPGTFDLTADLAGADGESLGLQVGLNQEVQARIVLSKPVGSVSARVVTYLETGVPLGVGGASVQITGVVGYDDLIPVLDTRTGTTDDNGWLQICTSGCTPGPGVVVIGLVEDSMDLVITATGYTTARLNGTPVADLAAYELAPKGRHFGGTISFVPASAAPGAGTTPSLADITFDVISAPPGTGQIVVRAVVGDDGQPTLQWSDSAQPIDPTGGRLVRPGNYVIQARLAGWSSEPKSFTVPVDAPDEPAYAPPAITMTKYGQLLLAFKTDGPTGSPAAVDVTGVTVVVDGFDPRTTAPGVSTVDFGFLPPTTYHVTAYAAGFDVFTGDIVLPAGGTPAAINLVRLGTLTGKATSVVYTSTRTVANALVTVTKDGTSFETTTGASGIYTVTGTSQVAGLKPGAWNVSVVAPGYQPWSTRPAPVTSPDVADPVIPPIATSTPAQRTVEQNVLLVAETGSLTINTGNSSGPVTNLTVKLTYRVDSVVNEVTLACGPIDCDGGAGQWKFDNLQPYSYSLNITSSEYAPVTLSLDIAAGEDKVLDVNITRPGSAVQGTVNQLNADGTTSAVEGAVVELLADGTSVADFTTLADGHYQFTGVQDGTYTVRATTPGGLTAEKVVSVAPGQTFVVDLVVTEATHSLTVNVNSSGADLTGALVTLASAAGPTFAAQPVVRTTGNQFTTTFQQVPPGSWTATVRGPAGHLGTYTGAPVTVPTVSTTSINVNETQVVLRAIAGATGLDTLSATVTPSEQEDQARTFVLAVNGSDTTVWIPRDGAQVTASATGWEIDVSPSTTPTVPEDATYQLVRLTALRSTTTTMSGVPDAVTRPGTFSVDATVTVAGGTTPVTSGTVRLERRDGTDWVPASGAVSLDADGAVSITSEATTGGAGGWPLGNATLRVAYLGATGLRASTSGTDTIMVQAATTTVLAYAGGELTATVSSSAGGTITGTVTFAARSGSGDPWTTVCASVAVSGGTADCAYAPTSDMETRATFSSTGSWATSQSSTVVVAGVRPTTTVLSWASGTLTARVTSTVSGTVAGSVLFQTRTGTTGAWTDACTVALAAGEATCAFAPTAASQARATFTGTAPWRNSDDGPIAVTP
ncbi:carboxypeptidase regulatory-like domain-containing protein [Cellulomonas composti]|uniref:alpha-amylase n=1 Tax=Cellulomonas composti TaxID=266130 RepID=A0A511JAN9_9CELL|nr:carboxypeptidase regulatory-like domain-containing protein [Cellulomonas composti]GEL95056.1 hypothetical protein CCO02nite_17140 [Cellulomonas composti]